MIDHVNVVMELAAEHSMLILAVVVGLVLVQWFSIQYLFLQNHFIRERLSRPHPDLKKISVYDERLQQLEGQISVLFEKQAEHQKELRDLERESLRSNKSQASAAQERTSSLESSFVSLGEINLKKRMDALRNRLV